MAVSIKSTDEQRLMREAGRLAAEMLLTVISQPGLPAQHKLLEAELILGQSTGPAPREV